MDHGGIVREAWAITLRERGLWGFGVIAALQSLIAFVVFGFTATLFGFTVAVGQVLSAEAAGVTDASGFTTEVVAPALEFINTHGAAIIAGVVMVFVLWLAIAVVEVATLGGIVDQLGVAASGQRASFRCGFSAGWRLWWRTASLYAIQFLPALVVMLSAALFILVPMMQAVSASGAPDRLALTAGLQLQQPISLLVQFLSIPLGVLVSLALRFAVVADLEWRASLAASWRLMRERPSDVIVFYLVLWAMSLAAMVAFVPAIGLGSVAGALLVWGIGAGSTTSMIFAVLFAAIAILAAVIAVAGAYVFVNAMWSQGWRALVTLSRRDSEADGRQVTVAPAQPVVAAPAATDSVPVS